jgi:hypothetical protein
MKNPTDEQIFNHMKPDDEDRFCGKCGSYDVELVEYDSYKTQRCIDCGYEPEPQEEF